VYRVTKIPLFGYYYQNLATVDPSISSIQPFQGLGASLSISLQPGTYAIAVKSHGGYGDLGNYTLSIAHSSIVIDPGPILTQATTVGTMSSGSPSPGGSMVVTKAAVSTTLPKIGGGAGALNTPLLATRPSGGSLTIVDVDAIFDDWATEGTKLVPHTAK
jgi:hypothetical protein